MVIGQVLHKASRAAAGDYTCNGECSTRLWHTNVGVDFQNHGMVLGSVNLDLMGR